MTTLFIKYFLDFLNNLYGNSILLKQSIPSLASKQIIIRDRYFVKPLLQLLIKIDINRIFRCRKFNFKEMCQSKYFIN
jgi:hypothetical protein